jgi:plasmid maintenance system antidote protein VapI
MIVSEAAKYLGITTQAVHRLIKRGVLVKVSTQPVTLDLASVQMHRASREGGIGEHVEAIRQEYAAGDVTQEALAKRYGVHVATISRALRGRTYQG